MTIDAAIEALRNGSLVVLPTDTVYGVAALPHIPEAIAALFAAKERPADKAIPVLGADPDQLGRVADLDDRALALADSYWPGPLTIVVPRAEGFAVDLGGGDDARASVAIRVPAHEVALRILRATGPLAVTSANLSGRPPASTSTAARAALGSDVAVYIDAGPCEGVASTVVELVNGPRVLRSGALNPDDVLQRLTS